MDSDTDSLSSKSDHDVSDVDTSDFSDFDILLLDENMLWNQYHMLKKKFQRSWESVKQTIQRQMQYVTVWIIKVLGGLFCWDYSHGAGSDAAQPY